MARSVRGPCHLQRYLQLEEALPLGRGAVAAGKSVGARQSASVEEQLAAVRDELLLSDAFARYLSALTGLEVSHTRAVARRFRAGLT